MVSGARDVMEGDGGGYLGAEPGAQSQIDSKSKVVHES